jgi:hypothetical protein
MDFNRKSRSNTASKVKARERGRRLTSRRESQAAMIRSGRPQERATIGKSSMDRAEESRSRSNKEIKPEKRNRGEGREEGRRGEGGGG